VQRLQSTSRGGLSLAWVVFGRAPRGVSGLRDFFWQRGELGCWADQTSDRCVSRRRVSRLCRFDRKQEKSL